MVTTSEKTVEVAKGVEFVDDVVLWERKGKHKGIIGMLKFAKSFPYKDIFAVIPIYSNDRLVLLSRFLRPKFVLSSAEKRLSRLLMKSKYFIKNKPEFTVQEMDLNALSGLTKDKLINYPIKFNTTKQQSTENINQLQNEDFIVLCPITSKKEKDEQACAIAAEGYARVNQKLAVVNVTTGPGGLNCLNGVFGQWTDSVPVLYISGQVKQSTTLASCPTIPLRQLGDQEVDIVACVKPLTKYSITLADANDIEYVLDKAVYLATHGRPGPVWIDIPINLQAAIIDETKLKKYDFKEDELVLPNIDKEIDTLQEMLKSSERPLIIAGHGITISKSKDEFLKLVDKLSIPVVTTMNGFDTISNDNKNFIARIGTVANRAGNFVLQNKQY